MYELFAGAGWDIEFSYPPESRFQTDFGAFATNDGVLTAVNPFLDGASRPASVASTVQRQRATRARQEIVRAEPPRPFRKSSDAALIAPAQDTFVPQAKAWFRHAGARLIGPTDTPVVKKLMARAREWSQSPIAGEDHGSN